MKFVLSLLLLMTLQRGDTKPIEKKDKNLFDVFHTGKFEWDLVFRGTPGVGQSSYDAFINYQREGIEPGCKQIVTKEPCSHHYRNNVALDSWKNVDEVALVLFKNDEPVVFVVFDGKGSNNTSWFHYKRVKISSYTDLDLPKNYFSLKGDHGRKSFLMSHKYGGCKGDEGWIVAVNKNTGCIWERRNEDLPRFLYAKGGTKSNWLIGETGDADVLAVFTKYRIIAKTPDSADLKKNDDCVHINNGWKWEVILCLNANMADYNFFDVFQTGKLEWDLVFRGTPGVGQSTYDAFVNYQYDDVEPGCKQIATREPCYHHYRNNLALDNWKYVDEVALVLYKNERPAVYVVFNGEESNNTNWFDYSNVKKSSFSDFQDRKNYFSLRGDVLHNREFLINHKYDGWCSKDEGWIVAVNKGHCLWQRRNLSYPRYIFAKNGKKSIYQSGLTGDADFLAVFVKYRVR